MFVPRGTEYHVSPIYLQVCTYDVSFPPEFQPEFLSPEFRTKLILPWNDLILTYITTESGNAAEIRGFQKMTPGRNRNTKQNAHPSVSPVAVVMPPVAVLPLAVVVPPVAVLPLAVVLLPIAVVLPRRRVTHRLVCPAESHTVKSTNAMY